MLNLVFPWNAEQYVFIEYWTPSVFNVEHCASAEYWTLCFYGKSNIDYVYTAFWTLFCGMPSTVSIWYVGHLSVWYVKHVVYTLNDTLSIVSIWYVKHCVLCMLNIVVFMICWAVCLCGMLNIKNLVHKLNDEETSNSVWNRIGRPTSKNKYRWYERFVNDENLVIDRSTSPLLIASCIREMMNRVRSDYCVLSSA